MKIESIRIHILKSDPVEPEWHPYRTMQEYPGSTKVRFGHKPYEGEGIKLPARPAYISLLRIATDTNLETCGVLGSGWGREDVEWQAHTFKLQWSPELVGADALNREYIWHKLWMARRYFHTYAATGPILLIDHLLWDLAGLHANLPVHKLLGGFRDRVPAYLTEHSVTHEEALDIAQWAIDQGYKGFKDHSMLGVEENVALARDLRDLVGDDIVLMHDPVQQYTLEDAIKVGRELEKLDYLWIEEPLQEYDINDLKRLSDALDLPVLALESITGNPYLAVPYLTAGAIDMVRQSAMGITGQMKLANLAEMFGITCHGGSPHVVAAVRNDDWWEHHAREARSRGWNEPNRSLVKAASGLIRDTTEVRDGYMYVPQTPGLGRIIDWERIEAQTIATI
ncbi:MAG: hypothetical protein CME19_22075 [Gemmatimonadetes bacterium]|nr:hypothetical protein [Gemmatimonadota bacterium]